VSVPIAGPEDVGNVLELFRLSYDRAVEADRRRTASDAS
jgi:hypothetical protein